MQRAFSASILLSVFIASLSGCATFRAMNAKQVWSQNYATTLEGVTATAPEMIDGDLSTSGQTAFKTMGVGKRNIAAYSEAVVNLPRRMPIHKIVIYSPNIKTFSVWADEGSGWKYIKEVKGVSENPVTIRVSTRADKVQLRVKATRGGTAGTKYKAKTKYKVEYKKKKRGTPADIQEFELYGLVTETPTTKETDTGENLDELLE